MRGMLAPPNCVAGQMIRLRHPTLASPFFFSCVTDAIDAISEAVPDALTQLDIGVEEVPDVDALVTSHMPLASAVQAEEDRLAQVIMYRRPIELRAPSREELRHLVFATLVEQVASATGYTLDTLDPDNLRGED